METLWGFSGWWCLVPMLFFVLLAVGCVVLMARAGGCGRMATRSCCGQQAAPDNEARP